jgi:creatinine amidohydrolase
MIPRTGALNPLKFKTQNTIEPPFGEAFMKKSENPRILRLECISHSKIRSLDKSRTLVLATMSPLEVHGPHLPLGQDCFEAYALAEGAAKELSKRYPDWTFLLLPIVPVATDCVPMLGSVNFPVRVVKDVAFGLLEPFAKAGFARLCFASFHGGPRHVCALEWAADELTRKYKVPAASMFSLVIGRVMEGKVFFDGIEHTPGRKITVEELKRDHHAGFVETAIGLHLWPDLVDEGWDSLPPSFATPPNLAAEDNDSFLYGRQGKQPLADVLRARWGTVASIFRTLQHFRTNTYHGYPSYASAEQGRDLFKHLVGLAADATDEFIRRGSEMEAHSPLWKFKDIVLSPAANKLVDEWLKIYT